MKTIMTVIGIILILFGLCTLGYRGYTYKTQEKIAEIGNVQITQEQNKTVQIPPILSGLSLVAGIVLVVAGRNGRR
ncbi:MAG: DUF3185 domain-containing protein [Gammaproteobacteria bacterium]|nr:DUF3185 domain-containing protein [Gammaproteobacteria bacterium]